MFKHKFWLTIFFVFNFFAVLAIATGMLGSKFAIILAVLQCAAIALFAWFDLEQGIYAALLAVPFYLAIPNSRFDALSAWRFAFLELFAVFAYKKMRAKEKIRFFSWDRNLKYFAAIIIFTILFIEPASSVGLKKFLFGLNIYLFYIVALNVVESKEQIKRALKVTLISLFTFVILGFVQLFASFSSNIYYNKSK